MELVYPRATIGNFGDELNGFVWEKLLPAHVFKAESTLLLGGGSILSAHSTPLWRTAGKRVFVIGSGAGYGPLPPDWQTWRILGVRGPLTAGLIGRPELAMTDSAALLASVPSTASRPAQGDSILLIPHHHSISRGNWQEVAVRAGMTFVDPRWPVPKILECFSHARLVVAEAMHGAIVADTLRIPWLPIVISPDVMPFQWVDWALSLELPYNPVRISSSSAWEAILHRLLVRRAKRNAGASQAFVQDTRSMEEFAATFSDAYNFPPEPGFVESSDEQLKSRFHLVRFVLGGFDIRFVETAAAQLREIAALRRPYLSEQHIFSRKLTQLQGAVDEFVRSVT